jgi:hypothetical protein
VAAFENFTHKNYVVLFIGNILATFYFIFNFLTVHFVLCLGITNQSINSYQFIISLSIDRYAPGRHMVYTQPHSTQNFINKKSKLACNSEGTDELPEDGTQLPKHVGAAK